MFERVISLIGLENFNKLQNVNIMLIGLGGVGGYTLETLVRSGIKNITIVDKDIFDITNLNRQLASNQNNIGLKKASEYEKRVLSINPDINITSISKELTVDNIDDSLFKNIDIIIDAIDDTKAKEAVLRYAVTNNKRVYSSMGTAKKLDPSKLVVTTLNKTEYDPLAKKMRYLLKDIDTKKIKVVYSKEEAIENPILASMMQVPASAGILLASEVIKDVIYDENSN